MKSFTTFEADFCLTAYNDNDNFELEIYNTKKIKRIRIIKTGDKSYSVDLSDKFTDFDICEVSLTSRPNDDHVLV